MQSATVCHPDLNFKLRAANRAHLHLLIKLVVGAHISNYCESFDLREARGTSRRASREMLKPDLICVNYILESLRCRHAICLIVPQ